MAPSAWQEHHEPRAVVPPPHVVQSCDILPASTELALQSPSSFGLGISLVTNSAPPKPFPLYYVSPVAAAERSPQRDSANPPGVMPGWYVIAQPGQQFELYASMLHGANSVRRMASTAQVVKVRFFVDATCVKKVQFSSDSYVDASCKGFAESFYIDPNTKLRHRQLRRFAFRKLPTLEGGACAASTSGSIRMELSTAMRGGERRSPPVSAAGKYALPKNDAVDEKDAVKKGISIAVGSGGEVVSEVSSSKFTSHSEQPLSVGNVTIFIRERFWMQSRRIIDEKGLPVRAGGTTQHDQVIDVDCDQAHVKEELVVGKPNKRAKLDHVIVIE